MYDIAIIGSGPAGVSAAINAKLLNKKYIWVSSRAVSKKVGAAPHIKNYPGLPDVTGDQLGWALLNHTQSMGIELFEEIITGVYQTGDHFTLIAGNKDFTARTVILCVGVETLKPIVGEEEFLGRGVSYCATCDGLMYRDKTICVYSTDKHYEAEIEYLCSLAKKVYVFPMYKGYEIKPSNAEVILKPLKKIYGDMKVRGVECDAEKLQVDGVFVLKNAFSPTTLVHGLKAENGHICVDRQMRTNIDGIFAAGDCTGRPYQYIKSAGEGNTALHYAVGYLNKK